MIEETSKLVDRAATTSYNYEIRPMRSSDDSQVSKLFRLVYGNTYLYHAVYRPEDLMQMIESLHTIDYVAVAENRDVVGHAGLIISKHGPTAEMGLAVVAPAHRRHGLLDALIVALETKASEMGLIGLCANAVTSHDISQREIIHKGFQPCGLELSAILPLQFRGITKGDSILHRESLMNFFKYLSTPQQVVAHVPLRHQAMVSRIYGHLGQPFKFGNPASSTLPGYHEISIDRNLQTGIIRVISADTMQWPAILKAIDDLEHNNGAKVVYLALPLAQSASALVCELAEEAGFFFSGIWPREAKDGDYLSLQRLNSNLDLNGLCIYSDFGKELFEYIKAQMVIAEN